MPLQQLVRFSYLALGLYFLGLISITTLGVAVAFPAMLLMCLCYLIFALGANLNWTRGSGHESGAGTLWLQSCRPWTLVFLALGAAIASLLAAYHYAGQTPSSVISSIQGGESLYWQYQSYNAAFIPQDSLDPYALLIVYLKGILLYGVVAFLVVGPATRRGLAFLLVVAASYAYLGLARGTSLEFFDLATLLIFAAFTRDGSRFAKTGSARVIVAVVIGLLASVLFGRQMSARSLGVTWSDYGDISLEPSSWLLQSLPWLESLLMPLYGYWGFGAFYMGTYLNRVLFESIGSLATGVFPFGYVLTGSPGPRAMTADLLIMGPRWHPDSAIWISYIGVAGLLVVCFLLGRAGRALDCGAVPETILRYFIFVQMLSLPVGNFVWVARTNLYIILVCLALMALRPRVTVPSHKRSMRSAPLS